MVEIGSGAIREKCPLADFLPTLTIVAKNLATEMTNYNVEEKERANPHRFPLSFQQFLNLPHILFL